MTRYIAIGSATGIGLALLGTAHASAIAAATCAARTRLADYAAAGMQPRAARICPGPRT